MKSRSALDVRRVGSSLVATFDKANPPLVWRFDLERNHSFTLALQGENEWELGITSVKGEFHPVARFPLKEDAEEALAAVGEILGEGSFDWVFGVLRSVGIGLLVLFLVLWGWSAAVRMMNPPPTLPAPVSQIAPSMPTEAPPASPAAAPESQNGVPLPADDVLKPPAP